MANASAKKISIGNKRLFEALIKSFIATFLFKGLVLSLLGKEKLIRVSNLAVIVVFIAATHYLNGQAVNNRAPLNAGFNQYVVDGLILLSLCNLLSILSEWMYLLTFVTILLPIKALLPAAIKRK